MNAELRQQLAGNQELRGQAKPAAGGQAQEEKLATACAAIERLQGKVTDGRALLEQGRALIADRDCCVEQLTVRVKVCSHQIKIQ